MVVGYQKNAPLCDCNRDRVVLARRSDIRPLLAQLRFHYNLCVSATFIPRPHCAEDKLSAPPSATIAIRMWPNSDVTLRPHYAAWALPLRLLHKHGVRTKILRRPSAFHCIYIYIYIYMAPFHGKLECFELVLFNMQMRGFISWKRTTISFKFESFSFQISCNVIHKVK